jgi:hypothetical protein
MKTASSIVDVQSLKGADCDSEHYLVVAEVRERLSVGRRTEQIFDVGKFNLKKLNDLEVKERLSD